MRGFSLGINVERPEEVHEIIAAVGGGRGRHQAAGRPDRVRGPERRFADPEENYWEVVYLESGLRDKRPSTRRRWPGWPPPIMGGVSTRVEAA